MSNLLVFIKYTAFWFGLHEGLSRLLPVPDGVLKVKDSKERKVQFFRYISDLVALVHAPLTCYFGLVLLMRDPKVFNEFHGPDYEWNLIVNHTHFKMFL